MGWISNVYWHYFIIFIIDSCVLVLHERERRNFNLNSREELLIIIKVYSVICLRRGKKSLKNCSPWILGLKILIY